VIERAVRELQDLDAGQAVGALIAVARLVVRNGREDRRCVPPAPVIIVIE
jgi:hypothetical protein